MLDFRKLFAGQRRNCPKIGASAPFERSKGIVFWDDIQRAGITP